MNYSTCIQYDEPYVSDEDYGILAETIYEIKHMFYLLKMHNMLLPLPENLSKRIDKIKQLDITELEDDEVEQEQEQAYCILEEIEKILNR